MWNKIKDVFEETILVVALICSLGFMAYVAITMK